MIKRQKLEGTPMWTALQELNTIMEKENMPPVQLKVVGGFALMMHGIRTPNGQTDIDYVGLPLSEKFLDTADKIGLKHHLGKKWINNDIMLSGTTQEDLEFSTGTLHFHKAPSLSKIDIQVLSQPDLLRMKIIAIDTACTAIETEGDFTRMKDLPDIQKLMATMDYDFQNVQEEFGQYLISPHTVNLLKAYDNEGEKGAQNYIDKMQETEAVKYRQARQERTPHKTSAYIDNLLNQLQKRYEEEKEKE